MLKLDKTYPPVCILKSESGKTMFRIKIILVIAGGALCFWGFQEFRVGSSASAEPEDVSLSDIESGNIPDNTHLRIGEHAALYPGSVYTYEEEGSGGGMPSNSAKVRYAYYPIISLEHDFMQQLAALENAENIDEFAEPTLDGLAVLVRTNDFKTIGAIPDDIVIEESVQGLVINRISSLDEEEKDLLRQSFDTIDFDKVLILSDDRKPSSVFVTVLMMLGGVGLSLVGIGLFFVGGE
ncbi:MAG: hypothetical protein COA78_04885 [Blastopirellula sp.]|nr:MAG: hypothetical protein COA78_04885 [Blastopirellula sp.]